MPIAQSERAQQEENFKRHLVCVDYANKLAKEAVCLVSAGLTEDTIKQYPLIFNYAAHINALIFILEYTNQHQPNFTLQNAIDELLKVPYHRIKTLSQLHRYGITSDILNQFNDFQLLNTQTERLITIAQNAEKDNGLLPSKVEIIKMLNDDIPTIQQLSIEQAQLLFDCLEKHFGKNKSVVSEKTQVLPEKTQILPEKTQSTPKKTQKNQPEAINKSSFFTRFSMFPMLPNVSQLMSSLSLWQSKRQGSTTNDTDHDSKKSEPPSSFKRVF